MDVCGGVEGEGEGEGEGGANSTREKKGQIELRFCVCGGENDSYARPQPTSHKAQGTRHNFVGKMKRRMVDNGVAVEVLSPSYFVPIRTFFKFL